MIPKLASFMMVRKFLTDGEHLLGAWMPTNRVTVELPAENVELSCLLQFHGLTRSHLVALDVVQPKRTIVGHHEFRIEDKPNMLFTNNQITFYATFMRPGHHHVRCYVDGTLVGNTHISVIDQDK